MIFNKNILKKFLFLDNVSVHNIVETLTSFGFSTEIIKDYKKINSNICVVKILKISKSLKHDSLNVCNITDGEKEYLIICGADNFKTNDFVILAKVGSILQNKIKIKKRKFGDYISEGMLCSYEDLGLLKKFDNKIDENGIIVLDNAILGDAEPLKYIGFEDFILETEVLPTYSMSKNIYGISKFLSKKLKIKEKSFFNNNFDEKKIIFNFDKKENKSIQCFYFKNEINEKKIDWLNFFLESINIKENDLIEKLIIFLNISYGILIKKFFLDYEPNKIEFKENKIFINDEEFENNKKNGKWILIIFENLYNKKFYPTSQILNIAINHFIKLMNEEFSNINIIGDLKNCHFRKNQIFKIKFSKIKKILGVELEPKLIKEVLEKYEFNVDIKKEVIDVVCPSWNEYEHENYVIEDIMRFYDSKNIEPKNFFEIPSLNFDNKIPKIKNKINDYLINIGFDQVKTYSLVSYDNFILSSPIEILENKKNKFLRTTLIKSLIDLNLKKTIFTIDKVFLKNENNEIKEKNKLTILFDDNLYFDVVSKSKKKINKLYLINLLKNILILLNIPIFNFWQKHSEGKNIFLDKKNEDSFFSIKGYDEIYFGNNFFGIIGKTNIREGSKFKGLFYLEIDIDILINTKKQINFIDNNLVDKEELIFRDYSILFLNNFEKKINVKFNETQNIEINNYNNWINSIKNIDSNIKIVELIDIYKNKTLTFRIWIDFKYKNKLFDKVKKKLIAFKNIKMI